MRIAFTQMLLMFTLTSLVSAAPAGTMGQGLLERRVSIDMKEKEISKVLSTIGKQISVAFTYSSRLIKSSKKVSLKVDNVPLSQVLDQIFDSAVSMEVVEQEREIILKPKVIAVPELATAAENGYAGLFLPVSGTVTNDSGQPLSGISVLEKGTSNGTTTDTKGAFRLNVADRNAVLVFSSVGYLPREIRIGEQSTLQVTLTADVKAMEDVIVVGYGTQKKTTLTGSVSAIAGKEITKSPAPNVTNNLAGRLPGLIVNQRTGEPGRDDPNILIRGNSVYKSNGDQMANANGPLIIIDGVPRSGMSRLNPEDVENISVLKDASAAIYGARA
ncbi:MAG: TonB-dependent receptor plug domain-containing protein, partial [Bacteroidetes bacterium]|nr:TonB-dependent receptor plug domain-containing protein [Bacteroidota bacterium]